jgi:hypothetical protein
MNRAPESLEFPPIPSFEVPERFSPLFGKNPWQEGTVWVGDNVPASERPRIGPHKLLGMTALEREYCQWHFARQAAKQEERDAAPSTDALIAEMQRRRVPR